MAKVSMHLGFTFRIGDLSTNQYARVDMNVDQIDTEAPVDIQLAGVKDTANQIWEYIQKNVDDKIVNTICDILCNIQTRALSAMDVTTDELQEAHEIVKQESKDIMEMAKLLGGDAEALLNTEHNMGKT